ncbi:DUF4158 domain-containing protein [Streptomyces sp. ME19-01-6]|uniref:DUF4158 domain-containing protein n=1 Tax=Streptomyces sp. ME19-01-6 TaxID=3028686 RepID=UPI0029B69F99|nr:DUF4158 domain-containing protein [Streptomyces sp. ME19-01-6]MDX3230442.1 DUF4158 domain-containing protein [Streptomyces sp. ME19-01-6]
MTSIERTAYPRFKRLITAHELHLFFAPTREEAAGAAERMDFDGHQLALLLALKSYQRMGRFPKPDEYPEMVVDFVRRTVELPEGTLPLYEAGRTTERQRAEVRRRVGTKYKQSKTRRIAEEAIRKEAASKNRPADLINIALEKVLAAGLELPAFSTFDTMASTIRAEVKRLDLLRHPRPDEPGGASGDAAAVVRARQRRHHAVQPAEADSPGPELVALQASVHTSGVAGRARRHRRVGGRHRRAKDHRLRRGRGCGRCLRTTGLRARQADRADGLPRPQGTDAGARRPGDDVLQAGRHEDQEGQGGAGGDPAR